MDSIEIMVRFKHFAYMIALSAKLLVFANMVHGVEQATIIFAAQMNEIASETKGGYPELASLLMEQREANANTFFLFGGDSLSPSPLSSLDRGAHIIDLLNSLEPDAMGIDKREFGFLEDELSLRAYEAAFPLVASNIEDSLTHGNLDGLVGSAVVQQGDYKLGIISVLEESVVEEYALTRIRVIDKTLAIERSSRKLREQGVDLVVLLYSRPKAEINELLKNNIIDLALCKEVHFNPYVGYINNRHQNDVLVNAPNQAALIQFRLEKGRPQSLKLSWKMVDLNQYSKDPVLLRQIESYTKRLARLLDQKIGLLLTPMQTRYTSIRTSENAFGNFIADAMKHYANADIGFINSGSIRGESDYPANKLLTRRDISKEIPFRNKIALLEVSGQQILDALENGFSIIDKVKGRYPQISGMTVIYNSINPVGKRVVEVNIGGEELNPSKIYKVATSDYLAAGGDGYTSFKTESPIKFNNQMSRLISDIVIDDIKYKKKISLILDSRLKDVNNRAAVSPDD